MSASDVSLSNRALLSIGARAQISALDEGSTESDAISTLFIPTFEALARAAPWNCLRNQVVLSLLAAAQGTPENPDGTTTDLPPSPWLYSYALPSDSLQIRYIVPSFPNNTGGSGIAQTSVNMSAPTWLPGGGGQINYAVAYSTDPQGNPIQVILCNQTQAQAVYTVNQPNPVIWDSLFQSAFVASLAAYLVPALSLNLPLMQMSIKQAENMITLARVRDGNEGVTVMDHAPDWLRARTSGTLYGYNNAVAPWVYANYDMQWPGGF